MHVRNEMLRISSLKSFPNGNVLLPFSVLDGTGIIHDCSIRKEMKSQQREMFDKSRFLGIPGYNSGTGNISLHSLLTITSVAITSGTLLTVLVLHDLALPACLDYSSCPESHVSDTQECLFLILCLPAFVHIIPSPCNKCFPLPPPGQKHFYHSGATSSIIAENYSPNFSSNDPCGGR